MDIHLNNDFHWCNQTDLLKLMATKGAVRNLHKKIDVYFLIGKSTRSKNSSRKPPKIWYHASLCSWTIRVVNCSPTSILFFCCCWKKEFQKSYKFAWHYFSFLYAYWKKLWQLFKQMFSKCQQNIIVVQKGPTEFSVT